MFKRAFAGFLRHIIGNSSTAFGAWLVAKGASASDVDVLSSGLLAAAMVIWSIIDKFLDDRKKRKAKDAAKLVFIFALCSVGLLALSGCTALKKATGIESVPCYERVAISKIALTQGYSAADDFLKLGTITADQAQNALISFDSADAMIDHASALCAVDENYGNEVLDRANQTITDVVGELKQGEGA